MTQVNRRSFIWQTSAGAAAVALAATATTRPVQTPAISSVELSTPTITEPIAAYVRNVAAGEIAIFIGTREVVIRDAALVRQLLQAAH